MHDILSPEGSCKRSGIFFKLLRNANRKFTLNIFWSELNFFHIDITNVVKLRKSFLPLGLKAQRGIAIMVAGGRRSVGRSSGVRDVSCLTLFRSIF